MPRGTVSGYQHLQTMRLGGDINGEPKGTDSLSGPGAINPDTLVTYLVTTGADALTLADGEVSGQIKVITMRTDGGDGTLTPTNLLSAAATTITFNDVGDSVILMWNKDIGKWSILSNQGCTVA